MASAPGRGRAVLEEVREEPGGVVLRVRLRRWDRGRCHVCGRRSPGYDRGVGVRRWRALDLGLSFAFIEAEAPRVRCRRHGVGVARVPWARHGSVFTRTFEDTVAFTRTIEPGVRTLSMPMPGKPHSEGSAVDAVVGVDQVCRVLARGRGLNRMAQTQAEVGRPSSELGCCQNCCQLHEVA